MENNNNIHQNNHNQQQQTPLTKQQEIEQQRQQTFQYLQMEAIRNVKPPQFPLARIKKIMKFDQDVRMISADAPILLAKACEMFILDLTQRSWLNTEESKRRILQKSDVAIAVAQTYAFDFLADVVPTDEPIDINVPVSAHVGAAPPGAADLGFVAMPQSDDGLPFYHPPEIVAGNLVVNESGMYALTPMQEWLGDFLEDVVKVEEKNGGDEAGPSGEN